MTMDLYGHLIDQNLWDAAEHLDRLDDRGGTTGAPGALAAQNDKTSSGEIDL